MKGEILTLETAKKLANYEKIHQFINSILKQAYTKYSLSSESVSLLLDIEKIINS
jgi:hypothetical protein